MKITCQACQAKYTIADEKVVGKVVKIRCKKCGATIVVNGNDPAAAGGSLPPGSAGAFDNAAQDGAQSQWMVNVADGDQRTMSEADLVVAYRSGVVNDETFCWTEGMADWLPIQEVAALHAACTATGAAVARAREREEEDESPTRIQDPSMGLPGIGTAASSPAARPSGRPGNGAPAAPPATSAVAARRAGGRAAAADLFRSAAQAGGEDEVLTSAPVAAPADGQKATATRNESRLPFEMGSPSGGAAQPPSMTATSEASGLIDIRQLGAQMQRSSPEEKKKSRVDDIMNLGGGGTFSPSLAAPVLSAPSLEHYSQPPPRMLSSPAAEQAKSKALIFLAIGAGIFFLVAAVGIAVVLVRDKGPLATEDRERTSATASGSAMAPAASVAMNGPSAPASTTSETPPPASAAASAAPPEAPSTPPAAAPKETAPKEPKVAAAGAAAPKEAPAAPASAAEFNMGETKARLASIAGGVQTCKRGDTTGGGKVEIVFAPSGSVQSATLMGGSPFDGTPTGKCVEARFRQAHVPAFGGSPFTVSKSFSIN
jgi:predicted Zn finger-like uncharacterized protein